MSSLSALCGRVRGSCRRHTSHFRTRPLPRATGLPMPNSRGRALAGDAEVGRNATGLRCESQGQASLTRPVGSENFAASHSSRRRERRRDRLVGRPRWFTRDLRLN
ncbi:hypothetical protein PYCCODRAFT_155301 [Trametes coccinea BRFM310]|uniref:Uncharacterized protein n=1 Tax=Trametes coccinea (strain BRFM310) TaxID=1353009 RepID=A0A1Y2I533_TRAC3|nr:hypothetical protein PYCCODRAFT_155301 [Trametes coccinea BRFM310]